MMRFQHLLPAFIGFFIVGTIIGLLIDGIGLGIILGLLIGAIATVIFWQFTQAGSFSPSAGSTTIGPPASIPTRSGGSGASVEDIIETEEAKKREKATEQPSRGLKPTQVGQVIDGDARNNPANLSDSFGESVPEPSMILDLDDDEPLEPEELDWLEDSEFEEESDELVDIDGFDNITQELGVSQQERARSTSDIGGDSAFDRGANREPGGPPLDSNSLPPPPPPPPLIEAETGDTETADEPDSISWLKDLAEKQSEGSTIPDSTSDRVSGGDSTGSIPPPIQPQPVQPSKPPSTIPTIPDPKPSLDIEKEKSIDDDWVPAEETTEEQPPKPRDAKPAVAAENVQFTLYHPKDAVAEQWYSLLTYIHVESAIQAVQADAKKFTAELTHDHREVKGRQSAKLTRGTEIRLVPHADGLEFNPTSLAITWVEDFHRADFRFRAGTDLIGEPVLGELTVYVGPLEIANLRFSIFVTDTVGVPDSSPETNSVQGEMYKRIFASYSHSDTPIVKGCVAAFKAIGYEVLIDYETLRSGEDWNEALERLIDEADIFQLFWSTNATKSKFVQQEWEYALKRRIDDPTMKAGEGFIRPVYWEQPTPNIPESLAHIHFKYLADLATLDKKTK
jgi:hypothetical protein